MDEDFEIIFKAKSKLPKIEDIPSVPTNGKSYSRDECFTLSSVNDGSPWEFPGFEDDICSCNLTKNNKITIFFSAILPC